MKKANFKIENSLERSLFIQNEFSILKEKETKTVSIEKHKNDEIKQLSLQLNIINCEIDNKNKEIDSFKSEVICINKLNLR